MASMPAPPTRSATSPTIPTGTTTVASLAQTETGESWRRQIAPRGRSRRGRVDALRWRNRGSEAGDEEPVTIILVGRPDRDKVTDIRPEHRDQKGEGGPRAEQRHSTGRVVIRSHVPERPAGLRLTSNRREVSMASRADCSTSRVPRSKESIVSIRWASRPADHFRPASF